MPDAGKYIDDTTCGDMLYRFSFLLVPALPFLYDEYLIGWMGMPVVAATCFKIHITDIAVGDGICDDQWLYECLACEITGRGGVESLLCEVLCAHAMVCVIEVTDSPRARACRYQRNMIWNLYCSSK